ncbi:MAG: hypothetical protein AAGC88_15575 [Bacteroidota bacterium]
MLVPYFLLAYLSIGCGGGQDQTSSKLVEGQSEKDPQTQATSSKIAKPLAEDFDEFYQVFNEDIAFQNQRIEYPLKGEFYDGTMDPMSDNFEYDWTLRDSINFELHNLRDNMMRDRESLENEVRERIYIKNSGFEIQLHFAQISGKWYLVYYSYIDA